MSYFTKITHFFLSNLLWFGFFLLIASAVINSGMINGVGDVDYGNWLFLLGATLVVVSLWRNYRPS